MQDEEGHLGSVRWEKTGWIQTRVLLTRSAGCSLGLGEEASHSSSPPHFTSPDPNPAEQTPFTLLVLPRRPLWLCLMSPGRD